LVMRLLLTSEENPETDLGDTFVMISREAETVEEVLYAFQQFFVAMGFQYVESLTAHTGDGTSFSTDL